MPNWCSNTVIVDGRKREIVRFVKYVEDASKEAPFSFNAILPMPEELQGTQAPSNIVTQEKYDEWQKQAEFNPHYVESTVITQEMSDKLVDKYGVDNWYDWCTNNWGTKWDLPSNEVFASMEPVHLVYKFDTAWSPPEGIYRELVKQFPKLTIDWNYSEENMELVGNLATDAIRNQKKVKDSIANILSSLNIEVRKEVTDAKV